ncbi:MAG: hypothetical protein EOO43_13270 [Flavobacterium sp.]|nr:MAG: hypothetical protein EOO43_13270 [Flavobacterium sp.]
MIDNRRLARLLSSALLGENQKTSVVSQLIHRKVPFHFGGMSDPFMNYELIAQKTFETLQVLKEHQYPTIISTKGVISSSPKYFDLISGGKTVIQVSFSTLDDKISRLIEINTPPPSERIKLIKELSSVCWVSARLQPVIPGNLKGAVESIYLLAEAGVKHISAELLKLPLVDGVNISKTISNAFRFDINQYYSENRIMALEYLVNRDYSLQIHTTLAATANSVGLSYSSADTDLLPYDGSDCCCSGVHNLPGFENFYKFTFAQSIRNAIADNSTTVTFKHLTSEWAPTGSIRQFLNSKSRVVGIHTIQEWMAWKWNNSSKAIGPLAFFGINDSGTYDDDGMKVFTISNDAFNLADKLGFLRSKNKC